MQAVLCLTVSLSLSLSLLCRELKRLSAVTLSPIYAHFTETLTGLQVIRAFRHSQRFARENEERLEVNQRAFYACKLQSHTSCVDQGWGRRGATYSCTAWVMYWREGIVYYLIGNVMCW